MIVFIILLLTLSAETASMSFFTKPEEEVVLGSPIKGLITYKSEPAVNAKLERTIKWQDDVGETYSVTTDESGRFDLPIKKAKVKLSTISMFVMSQEIYVHYNNEKYLIWTIGKSSKVLYGELGGEPTNFRCELTDEVVAVEVKDGLLGTSCVWDSIEAI